MASKDYYSLLWLTKSASDAEIKKAYKKKAMEYHPDRNKGDKKAEAKFKEINEAYQVLSDKEKKKNYDQFGNADFSQGPQWSPFGGAYSGAGSTQGFDFWDIFSQFGGMNGGGNAGNTQGFEFDLGDLFGNNTRTRSRRSTASPFEDDLSSPPPKKNPEPTIDVTETLEIPFLDFLFDTSVSVKTVYGKTLSLKVKAGTKPWTKFKIKWKWRTIDGKTGDMYVIVEAKMPKLPLSPEVEKLLEAIRYQV